MKILWVSDPPMFTSGYGIQTALTTTRLARAGHDIICFSPTYSGNPLQYNGVTVVGSRSLDLTGQAEIIQHADAHDVDIIITLKDPWVYEPWVLRQFPVPWVPVVNIDTEPIGAALLDRLQHSAFQLALTRNAQQLMLDYGIPSFYTPHGIDLNVYSPGNKVEARARLHIDEDVFMYLVVGLNNSYPSRKSLDTIILAYAGIQQKYPNSLLYLHTNMSTAMGGLDLGVMLNTLALPSESWRCTDQYLYAQGAPVDFMVDLFRAADVLVNPSMGGGFELACLEMQACGGPVIGSDWTAMRETIWAGTKMNSAAGGPKEGEVFWSPLGGWWYRPHTTALVRHLQAARAMREEPHIAEAARQGAMRYHIDHVVEQHWLPALADIESLLKQGAIETLHERQIAEDARRLEQSGTG